MLHYRYKIFNFFAPIYFSKIDFQPFEFNYLVRNVHVHLTRNYSTDTISYCCQHNSTKIILNMAVNIRYLITYFGKIHSIITLKSNYKLYTVIRLNYIQTYITYMLFDYLEWKYIQNKLIYISLYICIIKFQTGSVIISLRHAFIMKIFLPLFISINNNSLIGLSEKNILKITGKRKEKELL